SCLLLGRCRRGDFSGNIAERRKATSPEMTSHRQRQFLYFLIEKIILFFTSLGNVAS
ncbi:unnamed protein product, partial [Musa textilis]